MHTNALFLLCAVVFFNLILFSQVHSYNILAVLPFIGKSHFYVFDVYLKELARRGHNLTVISFFPQKVPLKNYHDINLGKDNKYIEIGHPVIESKLVIFLSFAIIQPVLGPLTCKFMLEDEEVQSLVQMEQKFDLVIAEQFNTDCALGIAHKLKAPVIGITSSMLLPWHYTRFGVPYNPSYTLYDMMYGGTKPSFMLRVLRTISYQYMNIIQNIALAVEDRVIASYYDDVPPLAELAQQIKFVLAYQHFVLIGSQVFPSNVIEVGGYHVAKPKEISNTELKKFIDESKTGVIYISFGSLLKGGSLKAERLDAIVNVTKELPHRIVWKLDKKIPNLPDNVYVSKWMPQNDILAHPNVVAFFSHCGLLGTTEAIHHGVPILGMPIFGDQSTNAAAIEESGMGVQIGIKEISKELLLEKFKIILDPRFRKNVKEISKMWKDRPISPLDKAVHWTEFAARYHNFTFRQPAADVPIYQYLGLDVILFLSLSLITFFIVMKCTTSLLYKLWFQFSKPKKD